MGKILPYTGMEKLSEHTKELLVVQNSMVIVILGLKQADHINMREVRKQINMLSVNQMSVYHTVMEAYNIFNRTASEQLQMKENTQKKMLQTTNYMYQKTQN